jgi:hypothetical protein
MDQFIIRRSIQTLVIFSWMSVVTVFAHSDEIIIENNTASIAEIIQPLTPEEAKEELLVIQNKLNKRIEIFGESLSPDDFEWTWRGRQLKQKKRQEVCGIFQGVVDEFYQMALNNKARLAEQDQVLLNNRNAFIERLGYKNNIVATNMGFDCRIR